MAYLACEAGQFALGIDCCAALLKQRCCNTCDTTMAALEGHLLLESPIVAARADT